MRPAHVALLLALVAVHPVDAQGWIVPRPCLIPVEPPECRDGRCRPVLPRPCPGPGAVERTASATRVELAGRVLRWEVDETFVNRGGALAEADYLFPLPRGAAFEDLRLEIDGELVAGEAMGADRARGIYEDIVRRQRDPALVEWMGSGLLRARIFPLASGKERRVVVRFQSVVEREGDALRIDYARPRPPRAVEEPRIVPIDDAAPRPGSDPRDDAPQGPRAGESGVAFTLSLPRDDRFGEPYSPTHRLRTSERRDRRIVTTEGDAGELTILVPTRTPTSMSVTVLGTRVSPDEPGFALITVTPPAIAPRRLPRDVTLVLDVSGSMRGRKMEQARAAGRQLLETLAPEDRFRLIDFATAVRAFPAVSSESSGDPFVPATRANLAAARRHLDELRADGSTNIAGALDEALGVAAVSGRLPLTLFVTDGEPTIGERDPATIAERAARLRGPRRLFTFGVGADVNAALVERLAVEGRGTASFVRPEESVERAVSLVARRLGTPLLTDVRVRIDGGDVRLSQMMPAAPQDIFAGQDLVLLARYTGSGTARLRVEGVAASGPVTWSFDARLPERERGNPFVARLWALQRIGWLSAERRRAGASAELDAELRALGERFGIPTELTSYLVLEPGVQLAASAAPSSPSRSGRASSVGAGVRRGELVVTGTVAPAPSMAADGGVARFEAAREAATRRDARTLADVDASAHGAVMRRIGDRTFTLHGGIWTDGRPDATMRVVRVKAYSRAWFDLAGRDAVLRDALALGDRVRMVGRRVVLEVGPAGVETLTARELAVLDGEW